MVEFLLTIQVILTIAFLGYLVYFINNKKTNEDEYYSLHNNHIVEPTRGTGDIKVYVGEFIIPEVTIGDIELIQSHRDVLEVLTKIYKKKLVKGYSVLRSAKTEKEDNQIKGSINTLYELLNETEYYLDPERFLNK